VLSKVMNNHNLVNDHSTVLGCGYISITAHVIYDPAVFVNETEYHTRTGKRVSNLQQQVEEPYLYLLAVSSSSGSGLIMDCCLLELLEPLCTSSGIQISDTLSFFLGEWGMKHPDIRDASALSMLVSLHDQHHLDASIGVPTKCPQVVPMVFTPSTSILDTSMEVPATSATKYPVTGIATPAQHPWVVQELSTPSTSILDCTPVLYPIETPLNFQDLCQ